MNSIHNKMDLPDSGDFLALTVPGKDPKQYHSFYPIDLFFETAHPKDLEQNFIISYFSPAVSLNTSFNFEEASRKVYSREAHQHDYFELVYIIKGEMYQTIENERHLYPEGSLCLLNRNIHHREEFSTEFRTAFLSIPPTVIDSILEEMDSLFFKEELSFKDSLLYRFFNSNLYDEESGTKREYIDFIPNPHNANVNRHMYSLFEQLTKVFFLPGPGSTYTLKSLLMQMFDHLSQIENYQNIPVRFGTKSETQLFNQITNLMEDSHGRISRSELEQKLNYNGAYINKIIKKYTNLNTFQYGMTFCMKEAKRLLLETELSISEIAEILEFSNRTHFYKVFKETYGFTPKAYREMSLSR